ncbi:hypothetical protein DFH06DRAFT_1395023 [Mycena polygramma]|nr:hypothetical protein DFH06DRAFT_1395023 [Mycena polygramma]
MKFSAAIATSTLFFATALGGLIPSPSAGDVADHINMATGIANDLSKQVGALTSSSSPADIQDVAQNVATKLGSFSAGAKSYGAAAQGAPAFGDADSQNVASAFNAFVPANQDLLNNLVSQHGLFKQADATGPIASVLPLLQGLLSSLGGVLSALIPSQGDSVQGAQGTLGGSLGQAISTFQ